MHEPGAQRGEKTSWPFLFVYHSSGEGSKMAEEN